MNLAGVTVVVLCLVIPGLVAWLVGRLLRTPQFVKRIAIVAYATALCVAGLFSLSHAFHLGIDLSGGTILVYQVEQPPPPGFQIDKMVSVINQRLNPAGITDVTIRAVGTRRVEITFPHASAEDVQHTKRILTSVGSLEFRIVADQHDHAALIEQAEETFPNPVVDHGATLARWVPVAPSARGEFFPGGQIAVRNDRQGREFVLLVHDSYNVTGEFLERAQSTVDETGRPAVAFQFNAEGAWRFGQLTGHNLPDPAGSERRLAIVLNGEIYSAPAIRSRISDRGIITGHFTQQEVNDLVTVLNAGSLPATLIKTPVSEMTAGPTFGQDTIVPASQRFAADVGLVSPMDMGMEPMMGTSGNWLLILEILFLEIGMLLSLYTAYQIARRTCSQMVTAWKAFAPWGLLVLALYILGIWLLFQPMQMRGMLPMENMS